MSEASELAGEATSTDPTVGLRAALALRKLAETLERLQVDNARRQGWSWQDIAAALQVTKQAVHKRYSAGSPPSSPALSTGAGASAGKSATSAVAQPIPSSESDQVPDPVEG